MSRASVTFLLTTLVLVICSTHCFLPARPVAGRTRYSCRRQRQAVVVAFLVTEDQVLVAVEAAEQLWAKALDARQKADVAAEKAEAAKASNDEERDTSHLRVVNLGKLADDMEADELVNTAIEISKEADSLEAAAEEALSKSEELLAQHLIDFPEEAS